MSLTTEIQIAETIEKLCELVLEIKDGDKREEQERAASQRCIYHIAQDNEDGPSMLYGAFPLDSGRNMLVQCLADLAQDLTDREDTLTFLWQLLPNICPNAKGENEAISKILEHAQPHLELEDDIALQGLTQVAKFLTHHIPKNRRTPFEENLVNRACSFLKTAEEAIEFARDILQTASAKNQLLAEFFCSSFQIPNDSSHTQEWAKLIRELWKDHETTGATDDSVDIARKKMEDHFWCHVMPSSKASLSEFLKEMPLVLLRPLAPFATGRETTLDIFTKDGQRVSIGEQIIQASIPHIGSANEAVLFSKEFGLVQLSHRLIMTYVNKQRSITEEDAWTLRVAIVCEQWGGFEAKYAIFEKAKSSGVDLNAYGFMRNQPPPYIKTTGITVDSAGIIECLPYLIVDDADGLRQLLEKAKSCGKLDKILYNGQYPLQDILENPEGTGFPSEAMGVLKELYEDPQ